jgi:hypothetical protein
MSAAQAVHSSASPAGPAHSVHACGSALRTNVDAVKFRRTKV